MRKSDNEDVEKSAQYRQILGLAFSCPKGLGDVLGLSFADEWKQLERRAGRLVVGSQELVPGLEVRGER